MLELTLVRHATTALNEGSRYQGWTNPPLSPRGQQEALRLRERLGISRFDLVLGSDLRRCTETAAVVIPDAELAADRRLRELHFGVWEGRTYAECSAQHEAELRAWTADPTRTSPPDGEAFTAFCTRIDAAIDALPRDGTALLIIHGGPIRRIVARALGLSWNQVVRMELGPCGITRLALHPEGGHLRCWNDVAHLEAL